MITKKKYYSQNNILKIIARIIYYQEKNILHKDYSQKIYDSQNNILKIIVRKIL